MRRIDIDRIIGNIHMTINFINLCIAGYSNVTQFSMSLCTFSIEKKRYSLSIGEHILAANHLPNLGRHTPNTYTHAFKSARELKRRKKMKITNTLLLTAIAVRRKTILEFYSNARHTTWSMVDDLNAIDVENGKQIKTEFYITT